MHYRHLPLYSALFFVFALLLFLPVAPYLMFQGESTSNSSSVLGITQFVVDGINFTRGTGDFVSFNTMLDAKEQIIVKLPSGFDNKKVYLQDSVGIYTKIEEGKLTILNTLETSKIIEGLVY